MYFICGAFNQHMSQFGLNNNNIFYAVFFRFFRPFLKDKETILRFHV